MPHTTRKLDEKAGGGEVRLYDIHKSGLPDLVNTPAEKDLAEWQWWLVHFPSRRAVPVKGDRQEGMRLLKLLEKGDNVEGLLPSKKPKPPQTGKKGGARGRARAGARADDDDESSAPAPQKRVRLTKIPAELPFDGAMKYAFPNQRIVHEIEKMLMAEDEVVMGGKVIGSKPNWNARKEGVKFMIEHAQGRAGEKPPPPPEKRKVSYEELEGMILKSPATRLVLRQLIEKAEQAGKSGSSSPANEKEAGA